MRAQTQKRLTITISVAVILLRNTVIYSYIMESVFKVLSNYSYCLRNLSMTVTGAEDTREILMMGEFFIFS